MNRARIEIAIKLYLFSWGLTWCAQAAFKAARFVAYGEDEAPEPPPVVLGPVDSVTIDVIEWRGDDGTNVRSIPATPELLAKLRVQS